jgi:hypothetical protein
MGAIKKRVSGQLIWSTLDFRIRHRLKPMLEDELQLGTAVELIYL